MGAGVSKSGIHTGAAVLCSGTARTVRGKIPPLDPSPIRVVRYLITQEFSEIRHCLLETRPWATPWASCELPLLVSTLPHYLCKYLPCGQCGISARTPTTPPCPLGTHSLNSMWPTDAALLPGPGEDPQGLCSPATLHPAPTYPHFLASLFQRAYKRVWTGFGDRTPDILNIYLYSYMCKYYYNYKHLPQLLGGLSRLGFRCHCQVREALGSRSPAGKSSAGSQP